MHASHVDVGLDSRRTAHSPATQTLDFLWLELTNRCNLRCVHCYTESHPHSGDRDVLTTQAYERLMREAYDLGCRKLQFIGGEPQLNRDFHKLLVTANTIGFEFIEVFSNLTQLDDETVCYAAQNGICFATSVYSDEPAAHDAITRVKSSHARTIRNLKKLIDKGIETRAATIVIDQDRANVKRTKRFLTALGVTMSKAHKFASSAAARKFSRDPRGSKACAVIAGPESCVSRRTARPIPASWRGNGPSATSSKRHSPRSLGGARSKACAKRFSIPFGCQRSPKLATEEKPASTSSRWCASRPSRRCHTSRKSRTNHVLLSSSIPSILISPLTSPNVRGTIRRLRSAFRARRAAYPTQSLRNVHRAVRHFRRVCRETRKKRRGSDGRAVLQALCGIAIDKSRLAPLN